VQRVAAGVLVEDAERARRLERQPGDAIVADFHPRDVCCAGEGRFRARLVAAVAIGTNVAGRFVPDERRVGLERIGDFDDGGQRLVLDGDVFGGLDCVCTRLGDDQRHTLTGVADLVDRERKIGRLRRRPAVEILDWNIARIRAVEDRFVSVGDVVAPGQHGQHARLRQRFRGVDRADARVRMRGAQDNGMSLTRGVDVVAERAAAGNEAHVLLARDRLADAVVHFPPPLSA